LQTNGLFVLSKAAVLLIVAQGPGLWYSLAKQVACIKPMLLCMLSSRLSSCCQLMGATAQVTRKCETRLKCVDEPAVALRLWHMAW
jgi:hypothetical protein